MRTLYIDCGMGAAGDMLTAALLELMPDKAGTLNEMNSFGIPGVVIKAETSKKCGISGTHITVTFDGYEESEDMHASHHNHEAGHEQIHSQNGEHRHMDSQEALHSHHHSRMRDIEHIISQLNISDKVKKEAISVYNLIAEAESHVHGVPVSDIHFHEVGTMDAVADIVNVCYLMEKLGAKRVVVSPVHVGSGQVKCAHGILPVPAPATAYILREVPIYGGEIKCELCTPTGAAILKYFADEFGNMPVMKTDAIGYGMGKKDFDRANCVRALIGEAKNDGISFNSTYENISDVTDYVTELKCNLDDMTAEAVGFAVSCLMEGGALDVYTISIGMKKNRPGTLLCVMCKNADRDKMVEMLFKYTTTLGVRESVCRRYVLKRRVEVVDTSFGLMHKKVSEGYGVSREKYEYEDIAQVARKTNMSIEDVLKVIRESE